MRHVSHIDARHYERSVHEMLDRRYGTSMVSPNLVPRYLVSVGQDAPSFSTVLQIRSPGGFLCFQQIQNTEALLSRGEKGSEWLNYYLQQAERLLDKLVFDEWFRAFLGPNERRVFDRVMVPHVKQVTYYPPVMNPQYMRSRIAGERADYRITPDWLATVRFKNGAARREILSEIQDDADGWFASMLMMLDQEELAREHA